MFKTILIATDGSADGDRALALATSMTVETHSRIVVVHVVELVGGKGGVYPRAADEDDLESTIRAQVAGMQSDGVQAEVVIESVRLGGPARVIAQVADSVNADLIVVGSKGRAAVSDVLLGSVPLRLLHIAHRPVLVVPPAPA
jgi:nucleotide-binding universal stress UspA family protein